MEELNESNHILYRIFSHHIYILPKWLLLDSRPRQIPNFISFVFITDRMLGEFSEDILDYMYVGSCIITPSTQYPSETNVFPTFLTGKTISNWGSNKYLTSKLFSPMVVHDLSMSL